MAEPMKRMACEVNAGDALDLEIAEILGVPLGKARPSSNTDDALKAIELYHNSKGPFFGLTFAGIGRAWRAIIRDQGSVLENTMGLGPTVALACCRAMIIREKRCTRHPLDGPNGTPLAHEFEENDPKALRGSFG